MQLTNAQKTEIVAGLIGTADFDHLIRLYAVGQNRYGVGRQGRIYDPDRYPKNVPLPELIVDAGISGGPAFTAAASGGGVPTRDEIANAITNAINAWTDVQDGGVYGVGPGLFVGISIPDVGPITAELQFIPTRAIATVALDDD